MKMIIKDNDVKWMNEAKTPFEHIKRIIKAIVLASPNFLKDFQIFYFAFEHTIDDTFLQKNQQGYE